VPTGAERGAEADVREDVPVGAHGRQDDMHAVGSGGWAHASALYHAAHPPPNQPTGPPGRAPAKDFVIAWMTSSPDTDRDVAARPCQADGTPQGSAFRVNITTAGFQGDLPVSIRARHAGHLIDLMRMKDSCLQDGCETAGQPSNNLPSPKVYS
jgi:hypothetical protein